MNGPVRMGRSPARWVAFGLGSGLLPVAPGTFGTLLAIPLVLLLSFLNAWLYAIVCVAFVGLAIMVADRVEHQLGQEDPGVIVIDEVVAFPISQHWPSKRICRITTHKYYRKQHLHDTIETCPHKNFKVQI